MSEHDSHTPQFTAVPLEKPSDNGTTAQDAASIRRLNRSTTSITTNSGEVPPTQNIRHSFPQLFVLPHLLKKHAWILLTATTVVMIIYIWLYLGALWDPFSRVKNVEILFYNADQGFDYSQTPPQVAQLYQTITRNSSLGNMMQGQIMDPSNPMSTIFSWQDKTQEPGWDRESLINYVEKGNAWGLLYIPANFSNNWLSYAPSAAGPATAATLKVVDVEYVYDQGRNYATHSIVGRYMSKAMESFSRGFEKSLLSSPANQTLVQVLHPYFWIQPIHTTETVMHPVLMYGQNFASYVVFIVQYIGSILSVFSICKYLPTTIETVGVLTFGEDTPQLAEKSPHNLPKFPALRIVLARNTVAMMFSFCHTIFIWMVPQVLHGHQVSEKYNGGIAFAFIWFVGLAFMSTLFLLSHIFTVDGFQLPATMLMILMFTSSCGILDWVITPGFYRIGIVFPFTYGVRGMRTIYFGSLSDEMWINWLVVFAWIVIPGLISMAIARSEIRKRRQDMRRTASMAATV
ncbi:hypothetical protein B0O80DRAFT_5103 [Mortierella sp. GBAus27b]|nr:hypothetical protein BGX31_006561 [Mortierella sp. GBA43]KAI8363057.1 hypothetical protein B0O80DRAFT_5103 [Mortierella sp. GBAus27b]